MTLNRTARPAWILFDCVTVRKSDVDAIFLRYRLDTMSEDGDSTVLWRPTAIDSTSDEASFICTVEYANT